MTNTKHTPGPWLHDYGVSIEAPDKMTVIRQKDKVIAFVSDENSRLISAAPELLAALELAEAWINDECERRGDEDKEYESPATNMVTVARTAIAKATKGA